MNKREFTVIMIAAAMIMAVLVPTNRPPVKGNVMPRMAYQFSTSPDMAHETPSAAGTPLGGFSAIIGSLFGSWAGRFVAQNF